MVTSAATFLWEASLCSPTSGRSCSAQAWGQSALCDSQTRAQGCLASCEQQKLSRLLVARLTGWVHPLGRFLSAGSHGQLWTATESQGLLRGARRGQQLGPLLLLAPSEAKGRARLGLAPERMARLGPCPGRVDGWSLPWLGVLVHGAGSLLLPPEVAVGPVL